MLKDRGFTRIAFGTPYLGADTALLAIHLSDPNPNYLTRQPN
jgi:hypothetical protein